jgi:hypothetical protein
VKPSLASRYIVFGRVNASARKITPGCVRCTSAMSHSQKAKGFVWGLSTRKIRTPLSTQKRTTPPRASQSCRQRSHWKSKGTMSWYFLGGFSAYWMEPSGRWRNHSGCSRIHGWSGEHWIARSRASSIPSDSALPRSRSKSVNVPSAGWIAVWPPSAAPIAHGQPTSPGAAARALFRPLRNDAPIGWIGVR